jgi:hypothetical protein
MNSKLVPAMKRRLLLIILLAFSFNTVFPAVQATSDPSFISKALKSINFSLPSEVTHTFNITRYNDEPYKLDTDRIMQLQKMYEQNFKIRTHLAKATYIATAGSLLWIGYKWGLFDWMLPTKIASNASPNPSFTPIDQIKDQKQIIEYLKIFETFRLQTLEARKEIQNGNWFINGIKYVGWTGVSIAGSIILHTKWSSFFSYALSEPSFKWFLSNHSIIATVDRLKRSVQALSSPNMPAEFSTEYHTKALIPALESLIRNTEQFIAFIDYYLPMLEENVVKKEAMNDISRYLFNITNDFLQKINPILEDPTNQMALLPIIDEYRADVATFINRCKVFEEEFFPAA